MWNRLKLVLLTATPTAILWAFWFFRLKGKRQLPGSDDALQGSGDQPPVPKIEVTEVTDDVVEAKLEANCPASAELEITASHSGITTAEKCDTDTDSQKMLVSSVEGGDSVHDILQNSLVENSSEKSLAPIEVSIGNLESFSEIDDDVEAKLEANCPDGSGLEISISHSGITAAEKCDDDIDSQTVLVGSVEGGDSVHDILQNSLVENSSEKSHAPTEVSVGNLESFSETNDSVLDVIETPGLLELGAEIELNTGDSLTHTSEDLKVDADSGCSSEIVADDIKPTESSSGYCENLAKETLNHCQNEDVGALQVRSKSELPELIIQENGLDVHESVGSGNASSDVSLTGSLSECIEQQNDTEVLQSASEKQEVDGDQVESGENGTTDDKSPHVFEFDFPSQLCGRLIGRQGRNVAFIREKSGANIVIRNKLYDVEHQVVVLEGTKHQVSSAVRLIKTKFPQSKFPEISYEPSAPEVMPSTSYNMVQLVLPAGVTSDVVVTRIVAPNHVFVQQPTHPSFHHLERHMQMMLQCYESDNQTPGLPKPYTVGDVCVARIDGFWYRVLIVNAYSETDECDVKLVDFGGYVRVPGSELKQIRRDFTSLPFQAIECYLYGVISPSDDGEFPPEATPALLDMVNGSFVQAQVVAVDEESQVPYILLTKLNGGQSVNINRELVNHGVARWLEL